MDIVVTVRNLSVGYHGVSILERLNFEVHQGEILVILGGSGCGKSTLLKNMIGLYEPLRGDIRIYGQSLPATFGLDRQRLLNRIGVMYQSGALFGSMNLLENVSLPLEEYTDLPAEARRHIALLKLRLVGLEGFASHMPSEISGGMNKRAAIARAMALDPGLLFLDEPSAGLDPITSAELDELIVGLSRNLGITFVVVTHELPSIMRIADRAIMLDKRARGVIAEGRPGELVRKARHPVVRSFFERKPLSLLNT